MEKEPFEEQEPFEPEKTETNPDKIIRAYAEISKETGSPYVFLSALIEKSGLDKETVHGWILMQEGMSKATLSRGDWSSASKEEQEAVLESRGEKMIKVHLNI